MAKSLSDILKGVNKSEIETLSVGDLETSTSVAEKRLISNNKIEKYADRAGNGPEVFSGSNIVKVPNRISNKGYNKGEDKAVYENVVESKTERKEDSKFACDAHDRVNCPVCNKKPKLSDAYKNKKE